MISANGRHRDWVAGNAPNTIFRPFFFFFLLHCLFSHFRKRTFRLVAISGVQFDLLLSIGILSSSVKPPPLTSKGVREDGANDHDDDGGCGGGERDDDGSRDADNGGASDDEVEGR